MRDRECYNKRADVLLVRSQLFAFAAASSSGRHLCMVSTRLKAKIARRCLVRSRIHISRLRKCNDGAESPLIKKYETNSISHLPRWNERWQRNGLDRKRRPQA